VLFLIPLQLVHLFCNQSKCILLFFSCISSLLLLFFWCQKYLGVKTTKSPTNTWVNAMLSRNSPSWQGVVYTIFRQIILLFTISRYFGLPLRVTCCR
jgi:hypothetical protein